MARRQITFQAIDDLSLANPEPFPDPADLIREDRDR
jgi:hypothetical protein